MIIVVMMIPAFCDFIVVLSSNNDDNNDNDYHDYDDYDDDTLQMV